MRHVLFMGSKKFGLELFKSVLGTPGCTWEVWHPHDYNDDRSNLEDWISFTHHEKVQFRLIDSKEAFKTALNETQFSMAIVCGWYWIIEETDLRKVDLGFWGIHNSLLPKYRGGSPLVWSMLSDDIEVGSSLFKLESGVDSGPIALQVKTPKTNKSINEILEIFEEEYKKKLQEIVLQILDKKPLLTIQEEKSASYCKQRLPEDSQINFNWQPDYVCRFVNVLQAPYPPAFLNFKGKKIMISKIEIHEDRTELEPGEVFNIESNTIQVAGIQGISYLARISLD